MCDISTKFKDRAAESCDGVCKGGIIIMSPENCPEKRGKTVDEDMKSRGITKGFGSQTFLECWYSGNKLKNKKYISLSFWKLWILL
jgi:hypothetical protein